MVLIGLSRRCQPQHTYRLSNLRPSPRIKCPAGARLLHARWRDSFNLMPGMMSSWVPPSHAPPLGLHKLLVMMHACLQVAAGGAFVLALGTPQHHVQVCGYVVGMQPFALCASLANQLLPCIIQADMAPAFIHGLWQLHARCNNSCLS